MSVAVAVMADDDHHASMFRAPSPSLNWNTAQSPHIYPHSHHGTPAQEYSGFVFNSPPLGMDSAGGFVAPTHQRPYHQLHPLVMPQWPSMLNSHQSMPPQYQPMYAQAVQPIQSMMGSIHTPVSATSVRSSSTPRRTLTDTDRKEMCLYAEKNPDKKQTEIGAMFGVERSTVSKVLRQKEKYLFQDDGSRSPVKRLKGRSPDIERALAVWARNQEKKGLTLTNEMIREKARAFLATTSNPESHPALSNNWIEKFKMKNSLAGAKSRKSSLSPDDTDDAPISVTPGGHSPHSATDASPPGLHPSNSLESLTDESGEDSYVDFGHAPTHSQSMGTLNAAYHESGPPTNFSPMSPTSSFFTPDSGTAPGPFMPHLHAPMLPSDPSDDYSQRPRRQTFPLIEQYNGCIDTSAPKFPLEALDSPMQEPLSDNVDPAIQASSSHQQHRDDQALDRPRSITPTNAMAPPPLPPQYLPSTMTTVVADLRRSHTPAESCQSSLQPLPSAEDARRAMETLYEYIQQQGSGFLDLQEGIYLGRLMEKVKRHSRAGSNP